MYQAYIEVFWQKVTFSDRLCNLLLFPQSTLQTSLPKSLLKKNLEAIGVFRVLMSPSRPTGMTSGFIWLGTLVVIRLNCRPLCASPTVCLLGFLF